MINPFVKIAVFCAAAFFVVHLAAQSDAQQIKRLNDKVAQLNTRIDELETKLNILLPELQTTAWWLVGAKRGDEAPLNNLDFLETKLTAQQIKTAKDLAAQLEKEMAAGKP